MFKAIFEPVVFVLVLGVFLSGGAVAANADGSGGIEEAKALYAEAAPLAIDSPKRVELLDQATAILKKVIEEDPKSLDAHRKLMGVYVLKQDYQNAIRTMQDAITLSPEDPKLFITLAFLYEHSGAFKYAKAMLEQALSLDPDQQLAKDYKLVIQQKIDAQNMQQMHEEQMMNAAHGKPMPGAHPPVEPKK